MNSNCKESRAGHDDSLDCRGLSRFEKFWFNNIININKITGKYPATSDLLDKNIMQKTRFLYGKKVNLNSFITTGKYLWFRDMYALGKLENQLICDDESIKKHIVNSDQIESFTINGREFKLKENSIFSMNQPTRRCHVLCLSNDGNSEVLFKRFKADICIEIQVEKLIDVIRNGNKVHNWEVVGKDVVYYKDRNLPSTLVPFELVFKKEFKKYHIENEFRIAIFWPQDDGSTVLTTNNKRINVFGKNPANDDHISLGFDKAGCEEFIVNVKELKSL